MFCVSLITILIHGFSLLVFENYMLHGIAEKFAVPLHPDKPIVRIKIRAGAVIGNAPDITEVVVYVLIAQRIRHTRGK